LVLFGIYIKRKIMPKKIRITERQKRLLESFSQYGDTYGFDNPTDSESIFKADLENELLTYAEEKGIEGNVASLVDYIMTKMYKEPKTQRAYDRIYNKLRDYGLYRLDTMGAPQRYTDGMDLDEAMKPIPMGDYVEDVYDIGGLSVTVSLGKLEFLTQEISINLGNIQLSEKEIKEYGELFKGYLVKSLKLVGGNIKKDQLSKIQSPERKIKNIDIGNTNPRLNEEDIKVGDKVDIKPGVISTPYTHGNDEYIYDVSVVQINGDKLTVMDMNGDEYSVQITDVE
jgi:hypothetical protein